MSRPYSEETQRIVDQQVALLLRNAEQTALDLLRGHRAALDRLAEQLLLHETVDGSVVLSHAARNGESAAFAAGHPRVMLRR